jgi:chemotaxis receptor (MCP) glutamine deamidase CheD
VGQIPRYIKNSKLHQALDALSRQPLNESELKRKINFTASVIRFNQNIVVPLVNDKFVTRVHMLYKITPLGEEVLQEMGRIKVMLPATTKFVSEGDYDGKELSMACVRPSGDDHFHCPSRRNDMLYFRDGRVEAI